VADEKLKKKRELLGEEAVPKGIPRTIENARKEEEYMIKDAQDEDLVIEELNDNYAAYSDKTQPPKVLITARGVPRGVIKDFMLDLRRIIPNSQIRSCKKAPLAEYADLAAKKGYTDMLVVNQDNKRINSMLLAHLPYGPTAFFRISSIRTSKTMKTKPEWFSGLRPEVIAHHFSTQLGRNVSRMLSSLWHYTPECHGRRVVTIKNQRDFIFFRHHVYEFKNEKKVALRELGPCFTLKLYWVKTGMMSGEYEWVCRRREQQTDRTKFVL